MSKMRYFLCEVNAKNRELALPNRKYIYITINNRKKSLVKLFRE